MAREKDKRVIYVAVALGAIVIDRAYGDFTRVLRAPDISLTNIQTEWITLKAGESRQINLPNHALFVFTYNGDWGLDIEGEARSHRDIRRGSAIGFESGRPHRWTAVTDGDLLLSWVPRAMGVLQQLPQGMIVIASEDKPYSDIMKHAVETYVAEYRSGLYLKDDSVLQRCSEITLIQFIRYAQKDITTSEGAPAGLEHDEYLLRAWTAYYAEPRRKWTVQALADAAGLARSSFSERFSNTFGAPPLQTITRLRLEKAMNMLLHSEAPLIEIAFSAGYNSEAAFVRAFHRQFGQPPGKIRTQARG